MYDKGRFRLIDDDIFVPEGIEAVWGVLAVCAIYVSPKSKVKQETIDHLIETIHLLRSKYDNDVSYFISGDFNRLDINDILDCYGGLAQVVSIPNRKTATLQLILTDLHTMYHPPTTMPPLQVDDNKKGKDGDHQIMLFAAKTNLQYKVERVNRTIKTRPIPKSKIAKYEQDIINYPWDQVFEGKSVDEKVTQFHSFLRSQLDIHFPEKTTKISNLDKKWMSPAVKQLHRQMQREFYRHRKSDKYKKLKTKYKKMKRKAVKCFYSDFVSDLKQSDPGKWFAMAKKIGAVDQMTTGAVKVDSLAHLDNLESAKQIAEHYAAISNEYSAIDNSQLPAYLPAQPPPQVEEHDVYLKLSRIKKTKSTLPLDIPDKLRQECSLFLAKPLSNIINDSLSTSVYPRDWKLEWVTPAPKITHPKVIKDLRKISSTSDYSKVYEGFLKEWIMEDVSRNIDIGQYGGLGGVGTEHMIVCLLNRILQLLDSHQERSAVIMTSLDWAAAFDRQDPTIAIKKFIQLGVRPSLIPLIASYLTDRKMRVKFNGEVSDFLALIGGGPQGTLLGQIEYLVQSNDNADIVPPDDRYKYIDDLSILQLVLLSGLVTEYNFIQHVASDIGIDDVFLPPSSYPTQDSLDWISNWTEENKMQLNEDKCNYMVFSRSETKFATRLHINNVILDRIPATKLLGVWLTEELSWSRNCKEICIKAYSRLSLLTKLKYVGVRTEDLLEIYTLYIRSITEYCSVAFHPSLTYEQSQTLERIQRTCLRVILGDMYLSYDSALEMSGLQTLHSRREKRCLDFALKCIKNPRNKVMFPLNNRTNGHTFTTKEKFIVNWARTSSYKDSTIPYCQRLLNNHFKK